MQTFSNFLNEAIGATEKIISNILTQIEKDPLVKREGYATGTINPTPMVLVKVDFGSDKLQDILINFASVIAKSGLEFKGLTNTKNISIEKKYIVTDKKTLLKFDFYVDDSGHSPSIVFRLARTN